MTLLRLSVLTSLSIEVNYMPASLCAPLLGMAWLLREVRSKANPGLLSYAVCIVGYISTVLTTPTCDMPNWLYGGIASLYACFTAKLLNLDRNVDFTHR